LYKFKDLVPTKKHLCTNPDHTSTAYPVHIYHLNQSNSENEGREPESPSTDDTVQQNQKTSVAVSPNKVVAASTSVAASSSQPWYENRMTIIVALTAISFAWMYHVKTR
jgi:hypothetical protein